MRATHLGDQLMTGGGLNGQPELRTLTNYHVVLTASKPTPDTRHLPGARAKVMLSLTTVSTPSLAVYSLALALCARE